MSAVGAGPRHRPLLGSVRAAYLACVIVFGWAVWQFYEPTTGFTSLISIGDEINNRQMTKLRRVPHYVYEDSAGYDGAYYVQLAIYPTLQNPRLTTAIDNLQYRARRILFCWVAWATGFDRPEWIVQTFALINVASWLGLAWLLLRWFPATGWENFFRWASVMGSQGLCMSVRNSLVDGPALLLVAFAMAAWEDGRKRRSTVLLGLAGLGRETSLLATIAFAPGVWRDRAGWRRFAAATGLAAVPLFAWVLYLRWKFGVPSESGLNNFTLPLAGLAEKWGQTLAEFVDHPSWRVNRATLAVTVALTVQFLFFAVRWRPREAWWRIGATFAFMLMFLSTPVWEGFPGASARVLLPMTLAFNLLVPRGRRWLALLVAGNLTVMAGYLEFDPPAREFYRVTGVPELLGDVRVQRADGWYGAEESASTHWRWSREHSALVVRNSGTEPLTIVCGGAAGAARDVRRLRISVGPLAKPRADDAMVWSGELSGETPSLKFQFGTILPPGETVISFSSDKPAHPIGTDLRKMAFKILNLEIVVRPVPLPP